MAIIVWIATGKMNLQAATPHEDKLPLSMLFRNKTWTRYSFYFFFLFVSQSFKTLESLSPSHVLPSSSSSPSSSHPLLLWPLPLPFKGTNCRGAAVPPPPPLVPSAELQHLTPSGDLPFAAFQKNLKTRRRRKKQQDKSYFHGKKGSKYRTMGYGQILHRRGNEEDQVHLNVGGVRHEVDPHMLLRFPHTRLARLLRCQSEASILELCDDYSPAEKEYYFDRNPRVFLCVLNFYQTGRIHMMEELCVFSFSQEIEYWGIQELYLSPCCNNWYHERKEYIEDRDWDVRSDDQPSFDSSFEELSALDKDLAKFKGAWCAELRSYIWLRLEDPGHSRASKIIAVASLSVVLTSIVAMCVHSMPDFQRLDDNDRPIEDPVLAVLEEICIACFSAEFIIRLIVAPSRRKFLGNPLNIIDVASILPFYATLALETADEEAAEENEDLENVGKVVQVLRLMRVLRILKLARHSVGLRALGATVRHSYHEVGLLLLFLSVGISIFSALIYFAEKEEENADLGTIPSGWWWATITMTTVGYGDTCPVTLPGKLVATLCIICGLLVVALPITIIFNKFSKYYQRNKAMEGQGITKPERQDPELPNYNIRDLFTESVIPFIGGITFRNSVSSKGDETDASSLQDIEEYDSDTCENGATK